MITRVHDVKDWEKGFQNLKMEIQRNFAYNKDEKMLELTKLIDTDIDKDLDYYIELMREKGFQMSISDKIMTLELSKNKLDIYLTNYIEKQNKNLEFDLSKNYKGKILHLQELRSKKEEMLIELNNEFRKFKNKILTYD